MPILEPQSSTMNLPINIKISALEKAINSEITGLIYQDNSFDNYGKDDLKVKVWKKDKIRLALKDNTISYYVPLKLWIAVRYGVLGFTDTKAVEGAIALNMETKFNIEEDWQLVTKTTLKNYKWLETPKLDLGIAKMSITYVADRVLATNKKMLTESIDEQIKKNLDIKSYANDAWKMAQDPILLDSTYSAWLRLTPESVEMTPFKSINGIIKSTIGIKAISEVLIGDEPVVMKKSKLPPFKEVSKIDDNFSISLTTDIPYAEAEQLAESKLVGETFSQGKKSVTVQDIGVFGKDGKLMVSAALTGKVKGSIYMTGKPVYNPETSTIELQDFDFDLKSKNILHKSANWLLHSTILKRIEPYLNFPMEETLTSSKKMVEDNLSNYEVVKGILLNGKLDEMDIQGIHLTETGIKVLISANGKIELNVEGLNY